MLPCTCAAVEVKDRRAVVYFSYEAQDEDELTITPGQVHTAIMGLKNVYIWLYTMIVSAGCPCAWQGRRRMVEGRARGKGGSVSWQLCGTHSTLWAILYVCVCGGGVVRVWWGCGEGVVRVWWGCGGVWWRCHTSCRSCMSACMCSITLPAYQ